MNELYTGSDTSIRHRSPCALDCPMFVTHTRCTSSAWTPSERRTGLLKLSPPLFEIEIATCGLVYVGPAPDTIPTPGTQLKSARAILRRFGKFCTGPLSILMRTG